MGQKGFGEGGGYGWHFLSFGKVVKGEGRFYMGMFRGLWPK